MCKETSKEAEEIWNNFNKKRQGDRFISQYPPNNENIDK